MSENKDICWWLLAIFAKNLVSKVKKEKVSKYKRTGYVFFLIVDHFSHQNLADFLVRFHFLGHFFAVFMFNRQK